jgi:hypothetical protein
MTTVIETIIPLVKNNLHFSVLPVPSDHDWNGWMVLV